VVDEARLLVYDVARRKTPGTFGSHPEMEIVLDGLLASEIHPIFLYSTRSINPLESKHVSMKYQSSISSKHATPPPSASSINSSL
jgi:hypothetical protein